MTVMLLFVGLMSVVAASPHRCPDLCTCSQNNKVNCSNTQLQWVPSQIPLQVSHLTLDGNTMLNISNNSFSKYKLLTHLTMAHNGLREVGPGTFNWQRKLLSLNLSHNSLSVLDENMFTGLSHLQVLDASNNEIREIRGNLCLAMPKLRALYLGGNKLSVIPDGLNHCTFLKQLHLQNNSIGSVNSSTLQNLSQLTHFDLQNNTISELIPRSLKSLSNLTHLYMAGNKISKIKKNSLKGLDSLRVLDLSNNQIKTTQPRAFKHTQNLEKLFLNKNQYRKLSKHGFSPSLKVLHLRGNKLTELSRKPFRPLSKLEILDLSDNKIEHENPMPDSSTSPSPITTKVLQKNAPLPEIPSSPNLDQPPVASTGADESGSQKWLSQPMIVLIAMVAVVVLAIFVLTFFVRKMWQKTGGKKRKNAAAWLQGANGHEQLCQPWMRAITKNYVNLVDNMRAKDLTKYLIQDGILTLQMQEEIKHERTERDQNEKLLSFLRGEEAVKCLIKALKQNGSNDLATSLEVQLMPKTPDQV
ncbi:Caspase 9, apoptosis- cysteine protease [Branchiostoma belcheri]|nr:Caspase 9, apoptosis- cysteine protease [Branchiostoma belcheri]